MIIDSIINTSNTTPEKNFTRASSGGNSYIYEWDSSYYIKGYCTTYFESETLGRTTYTNITKVSGGYTLDGNSGVSVSSQTVYVGQIGKTYSNGTKSYSMTQRPTGTSWNYSTPTSWNAIEADAISAAGSVYTLKIKRGTSSSTWTLELANYVFGTDI